MPGLKRTVTLDRDRPVKAARTSLSRDVARLKRQVAANRPEVRQQSYTVTIAPGPPTKAPTALIDPSTIIGDEFRLHRITVSYSVPVTDTGVGRDLQWGLLYSPKQGFSSTDLVGISPYDPTNWLYIQDSTKQRVWNRFYESEKYGYNSLGDKPSVRLISMEKKFSIPMKCANTQPNQQDPTVVHNQIYYVGANTDTTAATTLYVTIWFTDN